jgi:hypothetical protein
VTPEKTPLVVTVNPKLETELKSLAAQQQRLRIQRQIAQLQEIAATQIVDEQIRALEEQIERTRDQVASLAIKAPLTGTWFSPEIDRSQDTYLHRGTPVGRVGHFDQLIVRGTTPQAIAAQLTTADPRIELRVEGDPALCFSGVIEKIAPMGQSKLPSEALGYTAGGSTPVQATDQGEIATSEKIFEVRIRLDPQGAAAMMAGQRVIARIRLGSTPLLFQWYRSARQLFQRRFYI